MSEIENFLDKKNNEKQIKNKTNYIKIINKLIENGIDKKEVLEAFDNYDKNKLLYKNHKIYFQDFFKKSFEHNNFEKFRDKMYEADLIQRQKRILRRLKSNRDLVNEKTKEIALELAEEGLDYEFIGDVIGNKIASVFDSISLNQILQDQLDNVRGHWNIKNVKNKVSKYNTEIVSEKDNKLVVKVKDFNSSANLGTKNWCLVRNKSDFEEYTNGQDGYQELYFVYDFNKSSEDNSSLIAVLTKPNGSVSEVYNRKDDKINNKNVNEITFTPMDRNELKDKIIKDSGNSIYNLGENFIIYGYYNEAKEKLNNYKENSYKKTLSRLFANNVGSIVYKGDVLNFFNEIEKERVEHLNSFEIASWIREVVYADKVEDLLKILDKNIIKNILKEDPEGDHLKIGLTNTFNDIFSKSDIDKLKLGKKLIEKISDIISFKSLDNIDVFEFYKYSEEALDYITKEIPDMLKLEKNKVNNRTSIFPTFDSNEEMLEKYIKFMNITEKDEEFFDLIIKQAKSNTLLKGYSDFISRIRVPVSNIIGKENFNNKSILEKEFIDFYCMTNVNVINSREAASKLDLFASLTLPKLNKNDSVKLIEVLFGREKEQKNNYESSSVVVKSLIKKVLEKNENNIEKNILKKIKENFGLIEEVKRIKKPKR